MKRLWIVLLLAACTHVTPEQRIAAAQPVWCEEAKDCELKWTRAVQWLVENSHWKIRTATENLLTTEGPFDKTFLSYEITKLYVNHGVYEIRFKAGCHDFGLGCNPDVTQATASFKQFVNGDSTHVASLFRY